MARIWGWTASLLTLSLAACGGSAPEPEAAETPAAEAAEAPAEPAEADDEPEADEAEAAEPETEKEEPAARKHSPKDVISSQGVMFTFSFKQSDVYAKAEADCEKKSGDDPAKRAQCMTKAHDQFDADSIAFRKDDEDKWWWTTIRRRGKNVSALHKIEFDFGEETDTTIAIKPKGRDMGSKPMRVPSQVVIEVPDDAGIFITDPKHGKMFYAAKMGLIGEAER